jgi:hypothetical protein
MKTITERVAYQTPICSQIELDFEGVTLCTSAENEDFKDYGNVTLEWE